MALAAAYAGARSPFARLSGRGTADRVKALPDSYDRLYARRYVRWEPGFDFSAPNHGSGLHARDRNLLGRSGYRPQGYDWLLSLILHRTDTQVLKAYTYCRGWRQDCVDPNGSCWGDPSPCMSDEGEVFCEKAQHRETVMLRTAPRPLPAPQG